MKNLYDLKQGGKGQNRGNKNDRQHIGERRAMIVQFLDIHREYEPLISKDLILQKLEEMGCGTSKRTLERDIVFFKKKYSGMILARYTYREKFDICAKYLKLIEIKCAKISAASDKKIRAATILVDGDKEKIMEESASPVQLANMKLRALQHRINSIKIFIELTQGKNIDVCLNKLKDELDAVSLESAQVQSKVKKLVEKYDLVDKYQKKSAKETRMYNSTIKT